MSKVHLVVVEWMGYPLKRKKILGENTVRCGLERILYNLARVDAGMDFDCTVVINRTDVIPKSNLPEIIAENRLVKMFSRNSVSTNDCRKYESLVEKYPFITDLLFRDNQGQDLGAYDFAYKLLRKNGYTGDILFINSSVSGPSQDRWLKKYRDLFYKEPDTGLCGITLNALCEVFDPHVQSFFLFTNMRVLTEVFGAGLLEDLSIAEKWTLIQQGEVAISRKILNAGYGIRCSAFPDFYYKKGDQWTIPEIDVRYKKEYSDVANRI